MNVDEVKGSLEELQTAGVARVPALIADHGVAHGWNPPAYAKLLGVKESKILYYMFRNAMLPQLTGLALALGAMVGGSLIAEIVFSYPGLGLTILTAIQGNDYAVITGTTLLLTICVLVANFTVDVLIGFLDPRVAAGIARSE